MGTIGIRELRQHASVHVRAAAEGEVITITDRGEPVAQLMPLSPLESDYHRQISRHGLIPAGNPHHGFELDDIPVGPALSPLVDEARGETLVDEGRSGGVARSAE